MCGATGRVSISVPQSSYVATGEAITPAVLSKMGSLGERIPDAEITYKDNEEPGTATASATFDAMPRPSAITKIEPSTTRGIEFAIWI